MHDSGADRPDQDEVRVPPQRRRRGRTRFRTRRLDPGRFAGPQFASRRDERGAAQPLRHPGRGRFDLLQRDQKAEGC